MGIQEEMERSIIRPTATVRVNNRVLQGVLDIAVDRTIEDSLSTATISMRRKPGITLNDKVTVSLGYNKSERTVFTGYITDDTVSETDDVWSFTARDPLAYAHDVFLIQPIKFGVDVDSGTYFYSTYTANNGGEFTIHEYPDRASMVANHPETDENYVGNEGVKAEAVVQWMLHMAGLAEGTQIQVKPTNFLIGDITPAEFSMSSIYESITQIADLIGWRIYGDEGGVVRFEQRPRNASSYTAAEFTKSGNNSQILSLNVSRTVSDIRNFIEIRGHDNVKAIRRASNPYIGTKPYQGVLISDDLIDTQEMAEYMAARVLNDLNRIKEQVALETVGNPLVYEGASIRIQSREVNNTYLVQTISHKMSTDNGYTCSYTCIRFPGDPTFEEMPADIIADFTITSGASIGDPTYMLLFDASASKSNRGQIVEYFWMFPDVNKTETVPTVWYTIPDTILATGITIGLKVTDASGATAEVFKQFDEESVKALVKIQQRQLYAALSTQGVGTSDAGISWNTLSIPAISVAASNYEEGGKPIAESYALFGCSDGTIHRTIDFAVSSEVVYTGPPDSQVVDIFIPEFYGTHAIAAVQTVGGPNQVIVSSDYGITWSTVYFTPSTLRQARYDYSDMDIMFVFGEQLNVQSYDGGASWTPIGIPYDVYRNEAGSSTNYFSTTDVGIVYPNESGSLVAIEGTQETFFPTLTVKVLDDRGVMTVDEEGQHYNWNNGVFTPTAVYADNLTRHMLRDGEFPIVYYASQQGVFKSLDWNTSIAELYKPTGSIDGRMVAYGPTQKYVKGTIFATGSDDQSRSHPENNGIFTYTNGEWVQALSTTGGAGLANVFTYKGGMAVIDGTKLHFISVTEGAYVSYPSIFTVPEPYDVSGGRIIHVIHGIAFSRKTPNKMYVTWSKQFDGHDTSANRELEFYVSTWNNVKASQSTYTTMRILPSLTHNNFFGNQFDQGMHHTPTAKTNDGVLMKFFGHSAWEGVIHVNLETGDVSHGTVTFGNGLTWGLVHKSADLHRFVRFEGVFGMLIQLSGSLHTPTGPNDTEVSPVTPTPAIARSLGLADGLSGLNITYSEDSLDSVLYNTGTEIVKHTDYMRGTDTTLYTATEAGENELKVLTNTPDAVQALDYLAVIASTGSPRFTRIVHFSANSGQSWSKGPALLGHMNAAFHIPG